MERRTTLLDKTYSGRLLKCCFWKCNRIGHIRYEGASVYQGSCCIMITVDAWDKSLVVYFLVRCWNSFWFGEERPRWLGPIPYDYPVHLTGELPGDYGFDVAGLGKDPVAFQKYFNFEILHARWAMLAALGALILELLDISGLIHFVEPVWWRVGYAKLQAICNCVQQGDTLDYLGIPGLHIAGSQGVLVIAICQVLLIVRPEYARYCRIEALEPLGIYLPGDINYPGGALFDPLGLSKDPILLLNYLEKKLKIWF
ncbi:hypothetical protein GIB67_003689 [Kingdonia uniflora]|uniref:Chlorophyll a-b binding protein, chloroplastic n=1 Tax=Kingdonia uniflora TaxID=39325 RepID=A0A7J7M3T3_9MAGN|nr:hypothetical protein GIB67_003689 [Kingdonia uniflora]